MIYFPLFATTIALLGSIAKGETGSTACNMLRMSKTDCKEEDNEVFHKCSKACLDYWKIKPKYNDGYKPCSFLLENQDFCDKWWIREQCQNECDVNKPLYWINEEFKSQHCSFLKENQKYCSKSWLFENCPQECGTFIDSEVWINTKHKKKPCSFLNENQGFCIKSRLRQRCPEECTNTPTTLPSRIPSNDLTLTPSKILSLNPTESPTKSHSQLPTSTETITLRTTTETPSKIFSSNPSPNPSIFSSSPSILPSSSLTTGPTVTPSSVFSSSPSILPSSSLTTGPTVTPSSVFSSSPSIFPSVAPFKINSPSPSLFKSSEPSMITPTVAPFKINSPIPSLFKSSEPSLMIPTSEPTELSISPTKARISASPTPKQTTGSSSPTEVKITIAPTSELTKVSSSPTEVIISISPTSEPIEVSSRPTGVITSVAPISEPTKVSSSPPKAIISASPSTTVISKMILPEVNLTLMLDGPSEISSKKLLEHTTDYLTNKIELNFRSFLRVELNLLLSEYLARNAAESSNLMNVMATVNGYAYFTGNVTPSDRDLLSSIENAFSPKHFLSSLKSSNNEVLSNVAEVHLSVSNYTMTSKKMNQNPKENDGKYYNDSFLIAVCSVGSTMLVLGFFLLRFVQKSQMTKDAPPNDDLNVSSLALCPKRIKVNKCSLYSHNDVMLERSIVGLSENEKEIHQEVKIEKNKSLVNHHVVDMLFNNPRPPAHVKNDKDLITTSPILDVCCDIGTRPQNDTKKSIFDSPLKRILDLGQLNNEKKECVIPRVRSLVHLNNSKEMNDDYERKCDLTLNNSSGLSTMTPNKFFCMPRSPFNSLEKKRLTDPQKHFLLNEPTKYTTSSSTQQHKVTPVSILKKKNATEEKKIANRVVVDPPFERKKSPDMAGSTPQKKNRLPKSPFSSSKKKVIAEPYFKIIDATTSLFSSPTPSTQPLSTYKKRNLRRDSELVKSYESYDQGNLSKRDEKGNIGDLYFKTLPKTEDTRQDLNNFHSLPTLDDYTRD